MQYSHNNEPMASPDKGTVTLNSGDSLRVQYTDPAGKKYTVVISAQHLVLLVMDEASDATMLFRPHTPVSYIPPTIK